MLLFLSIEFKALRDLIGPAKPMELLVLLVINLSLQWSLGQNNCRIVSCQQYVSNEFTKGPTNSRFGYLHFSEERYYEIDIVNCALWVRSFVPKFCKIVWRTRFYCPQIKFAKVMFSQVSVCPRGGGVCLPLVLGVGWAGV